MTDTNVITAAGTIFAMSAALPATHDFAGFNALSYTVIGEVVDGGAAGKTFAEVTHSPLGEREVLKLKGSFDQGTRTLQIGRDVTDAGQVLLLAALETDEPVSFKITYQNGDDDFFTATVGSYTDDINTIDTIVGSTVTLSQRNPTIRDEALGVLTVTINNAGSFISDGTFFASQASTSGIGFGAQFTVTVTAGVLASVDSVDEPGNDYLVADTITLIIDGTTETTPAVLDVATVG